MVFESLVGWLPGWSGSKARSEAEEGRRRTLKQGVGRGSSSHDFGGDSRMIRRSSAEVTEVTVDRFESCGRKSWRGRAVGVLSDVEHFGGERGQVFVRREGWNALRAVK